MDEVRSCIEGDVAAGNGDKIAQLQLGPRQAVVCYLEGMLTREHLETGVEEPTLVDIPDVEVEGGVLEELDRGVATGDAQGNVL